MNISVIIPLFNEEESLKELCEWIIRVMNQHNYTFEIILIDDGSNDHSWEIIEALGNEHKSIKGIRFRRNYGKSAALNEGFLAAQGNVIITMDADLQDSPDEIPELYSLINTGGFDLISGWKKKRYDPISKTIPSKFFNWATRKMSGINNLHDFNCGLKSYRRDVIKTIEVYGEMHRYIPVIAKWAGFNKIGEKIVEHRARKYGETKFGFERFVNGFLDLLSITFVSRFSKRPMHLFGLLGSIMFLIGFAATVFLGTGKLYNVYHNLPARLLTERHSFYIALACMIIGTQLFLAGFVSELISRAAPDRDKYLVEKKCNL